MRDPRVSVAMQFLANATGGGITSQYQAEGVHEPSISFVAGFVGRKSVRL